MNYLSTSLRLTLAKDTEVKKHWAIQMSLINDQPEGRLAIIVGCHDQL